MNSIFNLRKKGFVFSLEAFFALILAASIAVCLFVSLSSIEQKKTHPDTLSIFSNDLLLEIKDSRQILNESGVSYLLNSFIPGQYCARLDVINENDLLEFSYTKLGCLDTGESDAVSKTGYVSNNKYYIARLYMWHRQ